MVTMMKTAELEELEIARRRDGICEVRVSFPYLFIIKIEFNFGQFQFLYF